LHAACGLGALTPLEVLGAAETASPVLATERMGQVLTGLLLVLGAIVACAWVVRRMLRMHPGVDGRLRLLGGLSLGPRERIVLVQAGETQLLVGVAPGRVQTLHVLDEPLAEHQGTAAAPVEGVSFARAFARFQPRARARGGA
jgi:flagellar protein FliO/FliZ